MAEAIIAVALKDLSDKIADAYKVNLTPKKCICRHTKTSLCMADHDKHECSCDFWYGRFCRAYEHKCRCLIAWKTSLTHDDCLVDLNEDLSKRVHFCIDKYDIPGKETLLCKLHNRYCTKERLAHDIGTCDSD